MVQLYTQAGALVGVWRRFWWRSEGQGGAEYALILALIVIMMLSALGVIKTGLSDVFSHLAPVLNQPT
jgi:Flp pilus assembly pilin Flp